MKLYLLLKVSIAVILICGLILLLFDSALKSNIIRVVGMVAYLVLVVVLYVGHTWKKNSLSFFLIATLGAQGVISMISNAAFGFQAAWLESPKIYNAIYLYIQGLDPRYGFALMILASYFLMLIFSGALAISSYILAKKEVVKEVEKQKFEAAQRFLAKQKSKGEL